VLVRDPEAVVAGYRLGHAAAVRGAISVLCADGRTVAVCGPPLVGNSPVFERMVAGGFAEGGGLEVRSHFGSAPMEQLGRFAAFGELELSPDTVLEIATAAHYYQMPAVGAACARYLRENCNPHTACSFLSALDAAAPGSLGSAVADVAARSRAVISCFPGEVFRVGSPEQLAWRALLPLLQNDALDEEEHAVAQLVLRWRDAHAGEPAAPQPAVAALVRAVRSEHIPPAQRAAELWTPQEVSASRALCRPARGRRPARAPTPPPPLPGAVRRGLCVLTRAERRASTRTGASDRKFLFATDEFACYSDAGQRALLFVRMADGTLAREMPALGVRDDRWWHFPMAADRKRAARLASYNRRGRAHWKKAEVLRKETAARAAEHANMVGARTACAAVPLADGGVALVTGKDVRGIRGLERAEWSRSMWGDQISVLRADGSLAACRAVDDRAAQPGEPRRAFYALTLTAAPGGRLVAKCLCSTGSGTTHSDVLRVYTPGLQTYSDVAGCGGGQHFGRILGVVPTDEGGGGLAVLHRPDRRRLVLSLVSLAGEPRRALLLHSPTALLTRLTCGNNNLAVDASGRVYVLCSAGLWVYEPRAATGSCLGVRARAEPDARVALVVGPPAQIQPTGLDVDLRLEQGHMAHLPGGGLLLDTATGLFRVV